MTLRYRSIAHIMGIGENAGFHHFLFPNYIFKKASFPGSLKVSNFSLPELNMVKGTF